MNNALNSYGNRLPENYVFLNSDEMRKYSTSWFSSDREKVARDINCSSDIVKNLSEDDEWIVRDAVLRRKSIPFEIMKNLALDENWVVRQDLARRKDLYPEIVRILSEDVRWTIRKEIADNPDYSKGLKIDLNNAVNEGVHKDFTGIINFTDKSGNKIIGIVKNATFHLHYEKDSDRTYTMYWKDGIWENGIWENGKMIDGIWKNGIWKNGIWCNGIWENGTWIDGTDKNGKKHDENPNEW